MPTKSTITVPHFYEQYVNAVKEEDLLEALKENTKKFRKMLKGIPRKKIDYAYEPGKWTIRELLQHIVDAERVFTFRALWFARKDPSPLPGFDENNWAKAAGAHSRNWKDLVQEFRSVRKATAHFYASLGEEQLQQTGQANNNTISVAAWGFISAGHVIHHMNILKERYL